MRRVRQSDLLPVRPEDGEADGVLRLVAAPLVLAAGDAVTTPTIWLCLGLAMLLSWLSFGAGVIVGMSRSSKPRGTPARLTFRRRARLNQ